MTLSFQKRSATSTLLTYPVSPHAVFRPECNSCSLVVVGVKFLKEKTSGWGINVTSKLLQGYTSAPWHTARPVRTTSSSLFVLIRLSSELFSHGHAQSVPPDKRSPMSEWVSAGATGVACLPAARWNYFLLFDLLQTKLPEYLFVAFLQTILRSFTTKRAPINFC